MKKRNILPLLLVLVALTALALMGSRYLGRSSGTGKLTSVKVEKEIADLGNLTLNAPADAVFRITNTGSANLVIESITPDCHCTGVVWDEKPVAPGAFTLVKITYDAAIPGLFQKLIQVKANVEGSPLVLIIRGNVEEKIAG